MGWLFWKRAPHPLDAARLRDVESTIRAGDPRQALPLVERARAEHGDSPTVRYLECLLHHEGGKASAADLLAHLAPVLAADAARIPEARLLEARLLAAQGKIDPALTALAPLEGARIAPSLTDEARELRTQLGRVKSGTALREFQASAEKVTAELARHDLVLRWRTSDLARLDSLLDEKPELPTHARDAWVALLGEIGCRSRSLSWRLALRPDDHVVHGADGSWVPGRALRERLTRGTPLYDSLHLALGTPRQPLHAVPGVSVVVEAGVDPHVVTDHVARALIGSGVTALGVFRKRPTSDGPVLLPLSFVDKGGILRALYIETRAWEPERVGDLRRWMGRLRASGARAAHVSLLATFPPPPLVIDVLEAREGPPVAGLPAPPPPGARSATPRSLDEPKLKWLDDKAEMMEGLVRASLASLDPTDIDLVRKMEATVRGTANEDDIPLAPKQWSALYGYGALFGRILSRGFEGKWTCLDDDRPPAEWEMLLPWGEVVQPIGLVVREARHPGLEGGLVFRYTAIRAASGSAAG